MGLVDLKNYVAKKVKPASGLAGILSCGALVAALVFALGTFLATVIRPSARDFFRSMEIISYDPDGYNRTTGWVPPYPQLVFCPLYDAGVISNMACWKSNHGLIDHMNPLTFTKFPSKMYPKNTCWGVNTDGNSINDWHYTVTCSINSTNFNPDKNITWAGRVRLYVDAPNATDYETCHYCTDGIDGTVIIPNYATLAFWQANIFLSRYNRTFHESIDFKTEMTRLPYEPSLHETSDMIFSGGFFSPGIWFYDRPDVLNNNRFHGEEVAHQAAFIGAIGLVSYFLWSCLSSTLILLFVGEQALNSIN